MDARALDRYIGIPYCEQTMDCADLAVLVQAELFGRAINIPGRRQRKAAPRAAIERMVRAALADHSLPLLVEYMGADCVWCQRLEPVLTAAVERHAGRLRFVKIDVERYPEAKPTDTPRSIPTIALYRDGRLIMTKSGLIQRQQLDVFLNHWLDPSNEGLN